VPWALTDDRASGRREIRYRVAGFAHMSSFAGNDLEQQPEIMRRVTERLRAGYDYRFHKAGVPLDNPNNAMVDEEFGDWFGYGGPASYLIDRFCELVDLGVDYFGSAILGPERERFAAEVIPAVKAHAGPTR
jgi:hypothetical protein